MVFVLSIYKYCTASEDWNVSGYRGLFCPSKKPSCNQLPGCVQAINAGGRRVFVVQIGHLAGTL